MPLVRRLAFVAFILSILPLTSRAQERAVGASAESPMREPTWTSSVTAGVPESGPRLDGARVGVRLAAETAPARPAPMRRADSKQSRTYMILGGAALLGGAIIGDDVGSIIMLGGLGVGLYGLYLYLQ